MIDRVMIQENIVNGQRIRNFSIIINEKEVYKSTAIGYKRIVVFDQNYTSPIQIQFKADRFVGDQVYVAYFATYAPCPRQ